MKRTALALTFSLLATLGVAPPPAHAAGGWSVAVLIYRSIDAMCGDRHIVGSLQQVRADPATVAARFASTADAWSGQDHSVTIFERGTLRSLSPFGSDCYPEPDDVSPPAGFDSVIVLWEADGDDPAQAASSSLGLSRNDTALGYAYSTAYIPDGDEWWFWSATTPELTMLHEWLHPVTGHYRPTWGDAQVPGVHDEREYGYTDQVAWHRDLMGGRIAGSIGLTPQIWATGTPTGGGAEPAPPAKPCRNGSSNAKACRP